MGANQISYVKDGNLIYCYFLSKTGERKKLIGTINLSDKTLYKKISPQKHTFKVSDSIGIAYELLKLTEYDLIQIQCGVNCYETTRTYFLHNSDFKRFQGYELQKLMKRDLFGIDRAESRELFQILKIKDIPVINKPVRKILQMELF